MASAFWQTVTKFDATKLTPAIAFRNTIGTLLPLVVGVWFDQPAAAAVVSLGALNVCYSDSYDPYPIRARRMLRASLLVAVAVVVGALSAHHSAAVVTSSMAWAFGAGMLVVLGTRAADLGLVTLVTLIVFAAKPLSLGEALSSGLLSFGGGLIQTALSVAIWPVRPYGPQRRVIDGLYHALANIAISEAGSGGAPPATVAVMDAGEALWSPESHLSEEAEALVFLLNQAERIRLSLLTLRRLSKRLKRNLASEEAAAKIDQILAIASSALTAIGRQASHPDDSSASAMEAFGSAVFEFQDSDWITPTTMVAALLRDAKRHVSALAGQMRAAAHIPTRRQGRTIVLPGNPKPLDIASRWARIQSNISLDSAAFRHAVRLALCVGVGTIIGQMLSLQRTYWLPMTIAIVLKPDFVSTFSRGILRIVGTLFGLFVATLTFHLLPHTVGFHIALLGAFLVLLRWIGPGNYGVFVTAISGIIVLLFALTGIYPNQVIIPRATNTALGGALALFTYWVWPTWERQQVGNVLGELIDAYRDYIRNLTAARSYPEARRALAAIRNGGRLARSNAEASVGRYAAEPGVSKERRTLLSEFLITSHAFARAAMAIESDLDTSRSSEVIQATQQLALTIDRGLESMATALRTNTPPANFPNVRDTWTGVQTAARLADQDHSLLVVETDRIATCINTMREQVTKWTARRN